MFSLTVIEVHEVETKTKKIERKCLINVIYTARDKV